MPTPEIAVDSYGTVEGVAALAHTWTTDDTFLDADPPYEDATNPSLTSVINWIIQVSEADLIDVRRVPIGAVLLEPGRIFQDPQIKIVADRAPDQELAAVDLAQQVGERMRNRLELADELAELLALARIRRRQLQCLAADAGKTGADQQLPFLDGLRELRNGVRAVSKRHRREAAELEFGQRR